MSLSDAYRAVRPDVDAPELEALLEARCLAAEQALPSMPLDRARFVATLAALPSSIESIDDEQVIEVAIALGCDDGDASALAAFELLYLASVPRSIASMKLADDLVDEVVQEVRRKLLVREDGPARIVGYAGRGSLHGLLKVIATRAAIGLLRTQGRESPADEAILDAVGEHDPELAFLKEHYRGAFREAFEEAVAALEPRERNLLRLHFLRKVTLDALARMYGVHRATIVRQIAAVRDKLDRGTRSGMRAKLRIPSDELEGVLDLIRSRFDASVERLLRTMDG